MLRQDEMTRKMENRRQVSRANDHISLAACTALSMWAVRVDNRGWRLSSN